MLPQINRLDLKKEFVFLKKEGKIIATPFFGLLFFLVKKNEKQACPRFAFLISSKVSKKAVLRNKLKRRLSAIIEGKTALVNPQTKAVFLVKGKALEASRTGLRKAVDEAFLKSGIKQK